jgi:hypothetical protein
MQVKVLYVSTPRCWICNLFCEILLKAELCQSARALKGNFRSPAGRHAHNIVCSITEIVTAIYGLRNNNFGNERWPTEHSVEVFMEP